MLYLNYLFSKYLLIVKRFGSLRERRYVSVFYCYYYYYYFINLTLNAGKCTFRLTKILFMGLPLTKHGIGPTKEKVKAIVQAR